MKKRSAFGLVEILIALIVLAIALMAIASTFALSSKLMIHTYEKEKAVMLASEKLDELEAGKYDDIVASSDVAGIYSISWKVTEEDHSKEVTMEVAWDGVTRKGSTLTSKREISSFAANAVLD